MWCDSLAIDWLPAAAANESFLKARESTLSRLPDVDALEELDISSCKRLKTLCPAAAGARPGCHQQRPVTPPTTWTRSGWTQFAASSLLKTLWPAGACASWTPAGTCQNPTACVR
jgi:hypothetical protein